MLPKNYYSYKQTPLWDETSIPELILSHHNTKQGVYGRIRVLSGSIEYIVFEEENGKEKQREILTP